MDSTDARKLLDSAKTYWSDIYKAAEEDLRFSIGEDHWSDTDIRARGDRPCLVINELPQFIHQTANDMRMNTPHLNVIPGDNQADIKTAEIFKGLFRYIEYRSGADAVYDQGGESSVRCSLGFMRVDHDYISDTGTEQELLIKAVPNVLSTWIDPSSIEPDGCDMNWAVSLDTMTKADFERAYPDRQFVSFGESENEIQKKADEVITIAEFYKKEVKNSKDEDGGRSKVTTIRRYKFNGEDEALEETTFPGKYIPVVPIYGEVVWIKGKRYILSLIRQAKDAQRRLNHWASKEQEILSMAPTAPVMAPVGAVDDFDEWADPGNAIVLRYNMKNSVGEDLERPERLAPPQVPAGFLNAMQGAKENIKETIGLYNSSLGQQSNEVSGVAINARDQQGSTSTLHFGDNLKRSIQHLGRIIAGAIPFFYDTPRIIHIVGDEEDITPIGINGAQLMPGQEQPFDLTKGQYDVRITTGQSYSTKRQEAAAFMGDLVKADPKLLGVFGDLLFKNMDVAGAQAVAERIKKTIPPQLLEQTGPDGKPLDPQVQALMAHIQTMQQQMQQMGAALQSKQSDEQLKAKAEADKWQHGQAKLQLLAKTEADKASHEAARIQLEVVTEQNKTAYERAKLQLEAEKLEIERLKLGVPDDSKQVGIKLDTTGFQISKTPEQQAKEDEQTAVQTQRDKERLETELLERQRLQAEMQEKAAQTVAVIAALGSISEQLNQLSVNVAQPIKVLRDANGAIIGAA